MTSNDSWDEISEDTTHLPEGYVGNLTAEHQMKLYQLWDSYFKVCDLAEGTNNESPDEVKDWCGVDDSVVNKSISTKKAIKNSEIEQHDEAKDLATKRTEEQNMEKLLKTYGPEALRNTFWSLCKQDHPDTAMLRFLRARKWDVDRATAMMASTLKWRLDTQLDRMSENGDLINGKEIPKFIDQQATGKVYAKGCNVYDQPVCYVHFKKHLIWGQPSMTMKKFIITQIESWRLLFVPPNDKMVIIFDCTGFGPKNLDMPNLLYVLQCLQSYFPECLAIMYLHNAPWFAQQAWSVVKGLLDPVVRSKVVFSNGADDLKENIPEDRLLEFVGGDVDMKFEWVDPAEGENNMQKNTAERERRWNRHRQLSDEFESVTRAWILSNGKENDERRRVLAKKLRLSQFEFEPYWRGKTVHHRNGDLPPGNPGIVRWQYKLKSGEKIRQIVGKRQCKKTLVRELQEIAVGASVDFVEKRTITMIDDGSWGHWSTLEDLPPPPTDFVDGKLVYDSAVTLSPSTIVETILDGPPQTSTANNACSSQKNDAKVIRTGDLADDTQNSSNIDDKVQTSLMTQKNVRRACDGDLDARHREKDVGSKSPSKTTSKAAPTNYRKDVNDEKRLSLFGSIKRKILV